MQASIEHDDDALEQDMERSFQYEIIQLATAMFQGRGGSGLHRQHRRFFQYCR
jgi:hypothetical protein